MKREHTKGKKHKANISIQKIKIKNQKSTSLRVKHCLALKQPGLALVYSY
jgi:hypothetical protein